jgi:phage terminase small subunit
MPEDRENELTAKQRAFVREYLIDLNATQAAIRAGYSEKGKARRLSKSCCFFIRVP